MTKNIFENIEETKQALRRKEGNRNPANAKKRRLVLPAATLLGGLLVGSAYFVYDSYLSSKEETQKPPSEPEPSKQGYAYNMGDSPEGAKENRYKLNIALETARSKLEEFFSGNYYAGGSIGHNNSKEALKNILKSYREASSLNNAYSLEEQLWTAHYKYFNDVPLLDLIQPYKEITTNQYKGTVFVGGRAEIFKSKGQVFLGFIFFCLRTQSFSAFYRPDAILPGNFDGKDVGNSWFIAARIPDEIKEIVRGKAYMLRGDVLEAENSFKKVLDLNPNNLEAKIALDNLPNREKWSREEIRCYSFPDYCR